MQPAGNLVRFAVEFAASVQHCHYHFRRRALFRLVHVHGNASAVVHHGDRVVGVHSDVDLLGKARQRFVHGIVHHLPHEMVQSHLARRPDVHRRPQPHGFQSAKHLDGLCIVLVAEALAGYGFQRFSGSGFFFSHNLS